MTNTRSNMPEESSQLDLVLLTLAGFKLLLHLSVNLFMGYGYFRDEFYYLACGRHLAFGYVDHPPLVALVAAFSQYGLGGSVFAIRLLPALVGAVVVYLTGTLAKEMGGGRTAQVIAMIASIAAPTLLGIHGFLSMNPFDHLFWTIAALLLIRILNGEVGENWIWFGITLGLGLMNKHGMAFFIIGIVVGLALSNQRRLLLAKGFWTAAVIAGVIFLPNIIWEVVHGFPTLEWARNASEQKNVALSPFGLFAGMVPDMNHASVPLFFAGLFMLLWSKIGSRYRALGWAIATIFAMFALTHGKPYYFATLYPLLFAAGGVWFDLRLRGTWWKWGVYALSGLTVLIFIAAVPFALAVLPVDTFIKYEQALGRKPKAAERNELGPLPQHFADTFGWHEMTDAVANAYRELPDSDKNGCAVFAQNYGEAGALEFLGAPGTIPPVICGHNNYWLWGPGDFKGNVLIIVGGNIDDHRKSFTDVRLVGETDNQYAMPYERHLGIYVCRNMKVPLKSAWELCRKYI